VLDKVAIISGTLLFGIVQQQTGSMRSAIIFLIFFFVLGLMLLLTGNWKNTDARI
jgi:UMF1 family MFS transporter